MNICVIDSAEQLLKPVQASITFFYDFVDPNRDLDLNPFLYIHSKEELAEKVALLEQWPEILQEVRRL